MTTVSTGPESASVVRHRPRRSHRPWYRWLLTALAFPPSGYVATAVAGRIDSVPAAVLGGLVAGAGIGTAQWALLRHRGVGVTWVAATAVGLAAGVAVGAALVSYRTDISSLMLMGATSGFAVGLAQGATLRNTKRMLLWAAATAALFTLGWTATTLGGIHVEEQFVVFGAYGAITLAFLQSLIVGAFVPARAVAR
jgi:hypothetical protein